MARRARSQSTIRRVQMAKTRSLSALHKAGRNPDLAQKAFAAGQDWWHIGQHTSGVANARVVRYGFLKWWNSTSPAETKGHSKSYLEKAFREGWNRGKKGPQRIPNGRMVPARIRHKGKTYPGKVKRVNGRVKIFVTPEVAKKINGKRVTSSLYPKRGMFGKGPGRKRKRK